jgi:hypothetical protein
MIARPDLRFGVLPDTEFQAAERWPAVFDWCDLGT